jgi:tRNA(Ile)-lysidine synthase
VAKGAECFDADKVGSKIVLRHWQPGDRFRPIGMKRSAKLQDIFTNCKIPRDLRHRLVLATTAKNRIFWVEGLRIGEAFKIGPTTKRTLQWSWRRHETC